jgi:ubiquitin-activating enzyme E1 C
MSNGHESKVTAYLKDETRYEAIDKVLDRRGPWTAEEFVGGSEVSI